MNVIISKWSIRKLISQFNKGNINLNPPYQRKDIWSMSAKKYLIDSIIHGFPIPNFILHQNAQEKFEMVDGQQRTRTILGFSKGIITDNDGNKINATSKKKFLDYKIPIIIVSDLLKTEDIEDVYDRVNSTGMKLNRPELNKAQYFDTKFLSLIETLADDSEFIKLNIFSDSAINRMNDIDFTGELVAILKFGISDKKKNVDKLFESDITDSEYEDLIIQFNQIINHFSRFNKIYPIKNTRYKQKNDFYTFFGFLNSHSSIDDNTLDQFYKILVVLGQDMIPSNEECYTLQDYAFNCISQSNSKDARNSRYNFFRSILLNTEKTPNEDQKDIMDFYNLDKNSIILIGSFYTFNYKLINNKVRDKINFDL
jgi:Protein of unknown function DUF262